MYSKTSLWTAAENLVGWSQSDATMYGNIPSDYKTSDSGYYVNDIPGVTVDLLTYISREKMVCDYIPAIHESETYKVIDTFIAKQKKDLNSKELLSNITFIQGFNDLDRNISRNSRFVGYVIIPRESKTIASTIQQAGFISPSVQSFTLYLFCTSQKSAIQTETITISNADTLEWTTLNWSIYFDDPNYGAGERYIIGYFEDDLSADLYEQEWTDGQAHIARQVFGHYMGVAPVRFNSGVLNSTYLPNCKYLNSSVHCKTSGFNLRFNTKCDITKVLTDNITMFGEAIQYQIAIRVLNDALSNIELNPVSSASNHIERWKELINQYSGKLHGGVIDGVYVPGIIDRLSMDFSFIDPICLKNKTGEVGGVKW